MSGGGTRPWAVRVQEGPRGKLIPFVVKLFKVSHLDQHPHLAAEMPRKLRSTASRSRISC